MIPTAHQAAILREAVQVIKQHRDRFDMDSFFDRKDPFVEIGNPVHNCNTVACLGGWIVAIDADKNKKRIQYFGGDIQAVAGDILKMPENISNLLFYPNYWPEEIWCDKEGLNDWHTITPEMLEERVEHFIKTGE